MDVRKPAGLDLVFLHPEGSGGLGRNRTTDMRIFKTRHGPVWGVRKPKKRNEFCPDCRVRCLVHRTCPRTSPSRRGASPYVFSLWIKAIAEMVAELHRSWPMAGFRGWSRGAVGLRGFGGCMLRLCCGWQPYTHIGHQ